MPVRATKHNKNISAAKQSCVRWRHIYKCNMDLFCFLLFLFVNLNRSFSILRALILCTVDNIRKETTHIMCYILEQNCLPLDRKLAYTRANIFRVCLALVLVDSSLYCRRLLIDYRNLVSSAVGKYLL